MQLGRYQILKELSAGSVTELLLARASGLEGFARHVVIKRIRPETAREERFVRAFLDEARIAGALHHHNIVQVHDVGEQDGSYFFAMEYVHGEDVRKLMHQLQQRNQVIPIEHAISIASATAAGLHHAHEQKGANGERIGLVHRDVSPSNILIGYDGSVKLVDFGMAKAVSRSMTTATGALKTKASYMSPEHCTGRHVDRRTDIFALGIVLFELVTAQRLFKGSSEFLTMAAIVEGVIPRPSTLRREVPPALDEIILRALQKDPDARYQTAEAFRESLEAFSIAQELRTSNKALADYLVSLFGARAEPWEVGAVDPPAFDPDATRGKGVVLASNATGRDLYTRLAPDAESPLALAKAELPERDDDDDEQVSTTGDGRSGRAHQRGKTQDARPPSESHRRTRPSRVIPAQTGFEEHPSTTTASRTTGGDTTATTLATTGFDDTTQHSGSLDDTSQHMGGALEVTTLVGTDDTVKRGIRDTAPSALVGDRTATRDLDVTAEHAAAEDARDPGLDAQTIVDPSRAHVMHAAMLGHPRLVPRSPTDEGEGRTVVEPPIFDQAIERATGNEDDDDGAFEGEPATELATDTPPAGSKRSGASSRPAASPGAGNAGEVPRAQLRPEQRRPVSRPVAPAPNSTSVPGPGRKPASPSSAPPSAYLATPRSATASSPPGPPGRPSPPSTYPPPRSATASSPPGPPGRPSPPSTYPPPRSATASSPSGPPGRPSPPSTYPPPSATAPPSGPPGRPSPASAYPPPSATAPPSGPPGRPSPASTYPPPSATAPPSGPPGRPSPASAYPPPSATAPPSGPPGRPSPASAYPPPSASAYPPPSAAAAALPPSAYLPPPGAGTSPPGAYMPPPGAGTSPPGAYRPPHSPLPPTQVPYVAAQSSPAAGLFGSATPAVGNAPGAAMPMIDLRGRLHAYVAMHRLPLGIGAVLFVIVVFALVARGCDDDARPAAAPPDASEAEADDPPDAAIETPMPTSTPTPIDTGTPRKKPAKKPGTSDAR